MDSHWARAQRLALWVACCDDVRRPCGPDEEDDQNEQEEKTLATEHKLSFDNAVNANIQNGVSFLKTAEPILSENFKQKKITIVGALYDLESGKVTFDPKN